jgi:hypothetical protein
LRSRWHYTPTSDHTAPAGEAGGPVVPAPAPDAEEAPAPKEILGALAKEARWQQLVQLIAKLPPDKAEQLRTMLGSDSLVVTNSEGFGQVLQALELRRGSDHVGAEPLMRRICQLLEPFLVDRLDHDSAGVIQRQSLVPWWEASMAQSAMLRDLDQQYRRATEAKIPAEMERLVEEAMAELARRAPTLVLKNIAQGVIEDVRHIGIVLAGGMALAKALAELGIEGPLGGRRIELDSVLIRRFARAYDALAAHRAFDPVWYGHAVMNRLVRPWEVVSLIHRVTGCSDVQMLEQTELAPLMDRTIGQLVAAAAEAMRAIREAAQWKTVETIAVATERANLFFDLAEAIAREVKLERGSRWGQAYLAARKDLSDLIPAKLVDFEAAITALLDTWVPAEQDDERHPARLAAMAAADFIGAMKLRAARHGFGMPFSAHERRMQEALGRSMPRPTDGAPDPWPTCKRRLLEGLRLA